MEELFGVSMNLIMVALLAIFLPSLAVVGMLAWRNRIMLKLGLRNIPRRRAQAVLIIIGVMLSSVIISAAFGTGDTISFSIRNEAVKVLGAIDEIIVSARATSEDSFASPAYIPYQRFEEIQEELDGLKIIDGLAPEIGETVPALNPRTSLSEGRMRVAGIDPSLTRGFDAIRLTSGQHVGLENLAEDEVYINDKAAEELDAAVGDELHIIVQGEAHPFQVKGVVKRGGLAGRGSTMLMPLERAQIVFGRPDQFNFMVVSNRGGRFAGADLSKEVTGRLRVLFSDRSVATRIKGLLNRKGVPEALAEREESLGGVIQEDYSRMRSELQRDVLSKDELRGGQASEDLISLLADEDLSRQVLEALQDGELFVVEREADTLFAELGQFRVFEVKRRSLEEADEAGSFVITFFLLMGLFSIIVGVLLIFLIFVMLAAARRSEMGMARALGAKRRHLVQMFLFEGAAYALVSAAVGVLLGLAISALIVEIANRIFAGGTGGDVPEDFRMTFHVEARTVVISYCLGMVITFATIAVTAYRVSRMNIVAAIRGLPTPVTVSTAGWREILASQSRAFLQPFRFTGRSALSLATIHPLQAIRYLAQAVWAGAALPGALFMGVFQLLWVPFRQGWLAFLLGVLVTWLGVASLQAAPFRIGVSVMIIGLGLMIRTALDHAAMRAEVADRIAYSFIGIVMLVFWVLPFGILRAVAGDLEAGIEMFFISGISMVAAAVWTVMYNSDLMLGALTTITGRIGKLRPVVVTAVAYPMSAKFRTGLTLAMFALVIFTLIVMSILTRVFDLSAIDEDTVTGGWDIQASLNFNTPIEDMRRAIVGAPDLHTQDFEAIGGYTTIGIEARQPGAKGQRWERYAVRAANDDFLKATGYRLTLIADGYGPSDRDVWQALRDDPNLAVVDASVVPRRTGFVNDQIPFELEGLYYEDDEMSPIPIEVREPRSGEIVQLTVIGVLDQLSDAFGDLGFGMLTSKVNLDNAVPFPVPLTTYNFRLADGVDTAKVARSLEASFQENGMETEVMADLVREHAAAERAFNYLFTGFMGLGLMVGIAALGVISLRAVVERRQQIGVLRAIGYRRRMIQLSFLLESSFVALLGIAIGVGLGTIISFNIVNDIRERENLETLRFSIPWVQIIAIIAAGYLFSLAATYLPARQASRIYPAEALRYE